MRTLKNYKLYKVAKGLPLYGLVYKLKPFQHTPLGLIGKPVDSKSSIARSSRAGCASVFHDDKFFLIS